MVNPFALIVEDETDIADFLAEALRHAGFETETLGDGRAALARLAEVTPDIVVLDLNLPFVSGEAVLRHIRADARLARTQVVVTTGEAQIADKIQDSADLVLLKPISYSQLHDLALRLRSLIARDDKGPQYG
jgi:two-component system OmpR family response regulator